MPPPRPGISAYAEPPPIAQERTITPRPPVRADASTTPPGELPLPPSDEPKEYAEWLASQPRGIRARIAATCRAKPLSYQHVCGGIGPLHIPYAPMPRARAWQEGDPKSVFASYEDWNASLSRQQLRYIDRECQGGEDRPSSDLCGDNTPLVVAFEGQPIVFTRGGTFAFQPGAPTASDFPTATTPWIALDRNHDGVIDSGAELFGSDTVLPGGTTAANGFYALAALDDNHDGTIDARDPAFASLVLWADRDGDRTSAPDELTPLSASIVSISLANTLDPRCDARHNCEGERAMFTWRDASGARHDGAVVDVYLPRR